MLVVSVVISSIGCSTGSTRAIGSRCQRWAAGSGRFGYASTVVLSESSCFHKRTQQTAKVDLDLARKRYKQVVAEIHDKEGERT